jgi:hypothetical protein
MVEGRALVEGPAWAWTGMNESGGLYPLSVEQAVSRQVGRLLPGVITTTTGARYYGLHSLAWADAQDREMEREAAEEFVRRCEVVMAGAYLACGETDGHRRRIPAAHGVDALERFIDDGALDVASAAARGGFSKGGFAGTYRGAEVTLRLLAPGDPPTRGSRASSPRSGPASVMCSHWPTRTG